MKTLFACSVIITLLLSVTLLPVYCDEIEKQENENLSLESQKEQQEILPSQQIQPVAIDTVPYSSFTDLQDSYVASTSFCLDQAVAACNPLLCDKIKTPTIDIPLIPSKTTNQTYPWKLQVRFEEPNQLIRVVIQSYIFDKKNMSGILYTDNDICNECEFEQNLLANYRAINFTALITELKTFREKSPNALILVSGHSNAGVLAIMIAQQLITKHSYTNIGLHTFGDPILYNQKFIHSMNCIKLEFFYRIIYGTDNLAMFSILQDIRQFRHAKIMHQVDAQTANFRTEESKSITLVNNLDHLTLADHLNYFDFPKVCPNIQPTEEKLGFFTRLWRRVKSIFSRKK